MERIIKCRCRIYDHFHACQGCRNYFWADDKSDDYAAYCTSMYLLQDSTEALYTHRERGFSVDALTAYLELWGVMQAIIIQQDALKTLYRVLAGRNLPSAGPHWKAIRNLRVLCAGHPADKGEKKCCKLVERTCARRGFGGYDRLLLDTWSQATQKTVTQAIALGTMIDLYATEAAVLLETAEKEMKRRWL